MVESGWVRKIWDKMQEWKPSFLEGGGALQRQEEKGMQSGKGSLMDARKDEKLKSNMWMAEVGKSLDVEGCNPP